MSGIERGTAGLPFSKAELAAVPGRNRYSGSNWWYSVSSDANTYAQAAGSFAATPLPVDLAVTVQGLAVRVTTLGTTALLGIYADDGYGYPDRLIPPSVGSIDTSATGTKTLVFPNVYLPPNLYWLACLSLTSTTTFASTNSAMHGLWMPHETAAVPDLQFTLGGFWSGSGVTELPSVWPTTRAKVNRGVQFGFRLAA